MADGYRYLQQGAGNYFYQQHQQNHHTRQQIIRNSTPPNTLRSAFTIDTPSPSRSPDSSSPAQAQYGMFNQGHQQPGQHGRVNGGPGRGLPMMYNYNQNAHQQPHPQHHANLQQDHATHSTNGSVLSHHTNYSSGVLSNATPSFTPNSLQNGHTATTRGGQAQIISEHWAEQMRLHKESETANQQMVDHNAPNHFARQRAGENRGLAAASSVDAVVAQDEDNDERGRPYRQESVKRQDWHNMDLSGQGLKVLANPLFNYVFLNELYVASNKITHLPASIGQLRHLKHLDASYNLLTELPQELSMCVYLKNLLVFNNRIERIPEELGSLYQLEVLGIEGNPHLAPEYKQVISEKGTKELIKDLREGAQGKSEQVLKEIQDLDADVICLQEVDTDTQYEFLSPKLAYNDYKGIHWAKSRSKTMKEADAKRVDGCAIFYKGSKYILLEKQLIDMANIAINRPDMKLQTDIFNRVMPRDNIAVVAFLENRMTGSRIMIVNTHLHWDPVYADVKLIQMAILVENVTKLAEKYSKKPPSNEKEKRAGLVDENGRPETEVADFAPSQEYSSNTQIPLLICGDLNSTSDSSVYELLSKGSVKASHRELKEHQYGNFSKHGIEHPFQLRSAYSSIEKTPDRLTFTNYTPSFADVIDHLWYSTNTIELTSLLGSVDPEYMKTVPGFPNHHFPSDHLLIAGEFTIKGRKEKKVHVEPDFGPSSRRRD
ncbi:hypothetical protein HYFRA_00014044 [Hymenoscyphus fraxineus]|uniref:CCR4-Not complex 3'-5'-exoribonuclease subunit Ccr4 n=1 Tax=Hymenoscyphus fraxineus TaxID=746836 RepID=A0A9N9Q075_9HELO|nr:hypothetical protein HYFRA_00014044 [Hymenoscyphus fraxineus]